MNRRRLVALAVTISLATGLAPAIAGWNQSHAVAAQTQARTMPSGNAPTVSVQGSDAVVSWAASNFAGGGAVSGYVVRRYDSNDVPQTVGSNCAGTLSALTCTETNVAGTWKWSVQPRQGNWVGAESTKSAPVTLAGYASVVLATSPAPSMYFRLGEASDATVLTDSSGNGRHGTYQSTGVTKGVAGGLVGDANTAVTSTGLSGTATVPTSAAVPSGSSQYSIEAWFRTTGTGDYHIAGWGSGSSFDALGVSGGNQITFGIGGGSMGQIATPASFASDRLWHHVVLTYNGSSVLVYFDGVRIGLRSGTNKNTLSGNPFLLGVSPSVPSRAFNGDLDEVAMYPGALSAAQVSAHFAASNNSSPLPVAPTSLAPFGSFDVAGVSWGAVTMPSGRPPVTSYVVTAYQGSTPVVTTTVAAPTTSAQFSNVGGSRSLTLRVAAFNAYGASPSAISSAVSTQGSDQSYEQIVKTDGAGLYYRLDDLAGPTFNQTAGKDYSGNGRDGVYATSGVTRVADGVHDTGAVTSTGTNDVLIVAANANIPSGTQAHSVEGWIRTTSTAASYIAGWGSGTAWDRIGVSGGNLVEFGIGGQSTNTASVPSYTDGNWHHVARTYDGAIVRVYFDGFMVAARSATLDAAAGQALRVGGTVVGGKFTGSLDEVAFYPTALSPERIRLHFHRATGIIGDGVSEAPSSISVTTGNNSATVSWSAATVPAGKPAITGYLVTAQSDDGIVNSTVRSAMRVGTSTLTATMTELSAGSYTFSVAGINFYGDGWPVTSDVKTVSGSASNYRDVVGGDNPDRYYRMSDVAPRRTISDTHWGGYDGTALGDRPAYSYVSSSFLSSTTGALAGDSDRAATGSRYAPIVAGYSDAMPVGGYPRTIEAWIKTTQSAYQSIVAWGSKTGGQDSIFSMRSSTTMDFHNGSVSIMRPTVPNLANGSWHHVVFTFDGSTARIYSDGVLRGTATSVTLNTAADGQFFIGGDDFGAFFDGSMDEVAIYSYALTGSQISAHYAARL